jgi:hypothetical protein
VPYLEDIIVGEKFEFGRYEVTAEEIVDYARRYDPQPIHMDDDAAREAGLGGLIASGWHSTCHRQAPTKFVGSNRSGQATCFQFAVRRWKPALHVRSLTGVSCAGALK